MLLSLILFASISGSCSRTQEISYGNEDNNKPIVDSIDYSENLLDSNTAYKEQFGELSEDGDWITVNKSDFISDLSTNTGEDLEASYPQNTEVIYVWRPYCSTEYWSPYSNGRWVFSYDGWIWVSDYNWGWGPYNYGRWFCSNVYGWVWIPGRVWAPNWVVWRCSEFYFGWYPSCPQVYWTDYRNHTCTNNLFAYSPIGWIFVRRNDFTKRIDQNTIVSSGNNSLILKNSQKIKKVAIHSDPEIPKFKYSGPDIIDIYKETGRKIIPKQIEVNNVKGKQSANENKVTTYEIAGTVVAKDPVSKINTTKPGVTKTNTFNTTKSKSSNTGNTGNNNKIKKEDLPVTKTGSNNTSIGKETNKITSKPPESPKKTQEPKQSIPVKNYEEPRKIIPEINTEQPKVNNIERSNEPPAEKNPEKNSEPQKVSSTVKNNEQPDLNNTGKPDDSGESKDDNNASKGSINSDSKK